MRQEVHRATRAALIGSIVALAVALGLGTGAARAQTTVPCYPPSSECATTTTTAATTTTTVARTTTSVRATTTTQSPAQTCSDGNANNGNGNNGNGNNGNGNNGNGNNGNGNGQNGGPPCNASRLTVDDTTPAPGQALVVSAVPGSFLAGSSGIVTIQSVEQQIGTFVARSDGSASTSVNIPLDIEPGAHTVFMKGTGADGNPLVLSRQVTVSKLESNVRRGIFDPLGPLGSLPRTGALIVIPAAILGLILLTTGVGLRRGSRRSRPAAER